MNNWEGDYYRSNDGQNLETKCEGEIQRGGADLFLISFSTHADTQMVENGRQWLFDNNIFVIESYDGFTQLRDVKFDKAAMWVQ